MQTGGGERQPAGSDSRRTREREKKEKEEESLVPSCLSRSYSKGSRSELA